MSRGQVGGGKALSPVTRVMLCDTFGGTGMRLPWPALACVVAGGEDGGAEGQISAPLCHTGQCDLSHLEGHSGWHFNQGDADLNLSVKRAVWRFCRGGVIRWGWGWRRESQGQEGPLQKPHGRVVRCHS